MKYSLFKLVPQLNVFSFVLASLVGAQAFAGPYGNEQVRYPAPPRVGYSDNGPLYGAQGPQGPQGLQGPQGPRGPQGERGPTGEYIDQRQQYDNRSVNYDNSQRSFALFGGDEITHVGGDPCRDDYRYSGNTRIINGGASEQNGQGHVNFQGSAQFRSN